MHHTSYDENGPMISIGKAKFSAHTGLPSGRQEFDVPAFKIASDESKVIVAYNGLRLTDFGTWNDYYGFGTSPETALHEAKEEIKMLDGCNVAIRIVTTLLLRPCFPSNDKPFYGGAQRVHHIPMTWRAEGDLCKEEKIEFVVWENGKPTEDAQRFFDKVADLESSDAAPARNGALRSIISRKKPSTREGFLHTETGTN